MLGAVNHTMELLDKSILSLIRVALFTIVFGSTYVGFLHFVTCTGYLSIPICNTLSNTTYSRLATSCSPQTPGCTSSPYMGTS